MVSPPFPSVIFLCKRGLSFDQPAEAREVGKAQELERFRLFFHPSLC